MKNKLTDLNNYLFEQIEKLNDDELKTEELDLVLKKSEAINSIADTIIKNADIQLKTMKMAAEHGIINRNQVKFLLAPAKENDNASK